MGKAGAPFSKRGTGLMRSGRSFGSFGLSLRDAVPLRGYPSSASASARAASALSRQDAARAELCAPSAFSTNTKSQ